MSNTEKINYLLQDIETLKETVEKMKGSEIYPVSFFSQTFDLTHKILNDLHVLETEQIEILKLQMEQHRVILQSMPRQLANIQPEINSLVVPPVCETPPVVTVTPPVVEPIIPTPEPAEIKQPVPEKQIPDVTQPKPSSCERPGVSLNEVLEKKSLSDFRKAFSLNDRFYFRRELFGGNEEKMVQAISDLNQIETFEESLLYLNNQLRWNLEDPHVENFVKILEKRFL